MSACGNRGDLYLESGIDPNLERDLEPLVSGGVPPIAPDGGAVPSAAPDEGVTPDGALDPDALDEGSDRERPARRGRPDADDADAPALDEEREDGR